MAYIFIYSTVLILVLVLVLVSLNVVEAEVHEVNVRTDRHVNEINNKFLSFTIDPRSLFLSSERYKNKECLCMSSSLSPSYIRVAGPSTSRLTFRNSSIIIDERTNSHRHHQFSKESEENESVTISQSDWLRFIKWTKNSGFELVFALNNRHRTGVMWDANVALDILTAAERHHVGDMYWQLGYECFNQSIEEYLNDLETLRVIVETFPSGKSGRWKVAGGDISHCLKAHSKTDFKDYVITSNAMMDAIFLDANTSSYELSAMSPLVHSKLLQRLSRSATPLWVSSRNPSPSGVLLSLGTAAASGFTVHFQELTSDELCQPSLNLYTHLLFKHLVGTRVLSVSPPAPSPTGSTSGLSVFGHCSSLSGRAAPGALTIYGVNDQPQHASFTLNITHHEGDMLQFVLGHDKTGNLVVNGRTLTRGGRLKHVLKHVRSVERPVYYLAPNSIGFWVLANAQIEACYDKTTGDKFSEFNKVKNVEDNFIKTRRSIDENKYFTSTALKETIDDINYELKNIHQHFDKKSESVNLKRPKRQTCENYNDNEHGNSRAAYKFKSRRNNKKSSGNTLLDKGSMFSKNKIGNIKHKLSKIRGINKNSGWRSVRKTSEQKYSKKKKVMMYLRQIQKAMICQITEK